MVRGLCQMKEDCLYNNTHLGYLSVQQYTSCPVTSHCPAVCMGPNPTNHITMHMTLVLFFFLWHMSYADCM